MFTCVPTHPSLSYIHYYKIICASLYLFFALFLLRDFNQLVRGDGATLDRPKFTIDNAFAIGPVDVKLSPDGSKIATSSVDNSLRVYSLQDEESKTGASNAGGSYELLCEAPA